jgi:hypothetical protein
MNRDPSNLRHQQQQQRQGQEEHFDLPSAQRQAHHQFSSVEELIRYDAAQTAPSDSLAHRVNHSIASEPKPSTSWWRRLFLRSS